MHYRYENRTSNRSAHLRYRSQHLSAPMLFDDATMRLECDAQSSAAHRAPELVAPASVDVPSFSAFVAAHHHRASESHTLDVDDVPALAGACMRILRLLADERWHLITEIRDVAQVLSYDRRLRDLRRLSVEIAGSTYYVHYDKRCIGESRLYEYRAFLRPYPQTPKKDDINE